MFVDYCSKCSESIYSSDEVVRTENGNFHYECTDEGHEDTGGTSTKQSD